MTNDTVVRIATAVVNNPAFEPRPDGTTFCNFGAQLLANAVFGYSGFNGLSANQIHDMVSTSKFWYKVDAPTAQLHANGGDMVICCKSEDVHGHVSVVVPGDMVPSTHFGHPAPLTANVGKTNGIMGANFGFSSEPDYFIYSSPVT